MKKMRIGVFGSPCKEEKLPEIEGLFAKLTALGAEVYVQSSFMEWLTQSFDFQPEIAGRIADDSFDLDIALSVGGDGTFLRTALEVNRKKIPILGINIGRLGFLADVNSAQIGETLEELFRGAYKVEERSLLQLHTDTGAFNGYNYALNEVAVSKWDTPYMITIHTYLNDDYLTSYKADGLLVATPTGSTAYSMSVNGPILLPQNRNIILSPVAPHSLNVRPLVIPDDFIITLHVESPTKSFLVALDGRYEDFSVDTKLIISRSKNVTYVVKRLNQAFYQTLREKLMWGKDVRS